MESGVASRPIADLEAYRHRLSGLVFRTGFLMKAVFDQAKADPKRVVYAGRRERRRAAGCAAGDRRGHRPAHPDRPALPHRGEDRAPGAQTQDRRDRPGHRSRAVREIRKLLPALPRADGAARRLARCGARRAAHAGGGDRLDDGPLRRCGCPDCRPRRPVPADPAARDGRDRPAGGSLVRGRAGGADPHQGRVLHHRHRRHRGSRAPRRSASRRSWRPSRCAASA